MLNFFKRTDYLQQLDPDPIRVPASSIVRKELPTLPKEERQFKRSTIISVTDNSIVEFSHSGVTEKEILRDGAVQTLTAYDRAEIEATKRLNVDKAMILKPLYAKGDGYVKAAKGLNREGFLEDTCKLYWSAFGRGLRRQMEDVLPSSTATPLQNRKA